MELLGLFGSRFGYQKAESKKKIREVLKLLFEVEDFKNCEIRRYFLSGICDFN